MALNLSGYGNNRSQRNGNFPSESDVGRRKWPHQRRNSASRKRCHIVLTICHTPSWDKTGARQWWVNSGQPHACSYPLNVLIHGPLFKPSLSSGCLRWQRVPISLSLPVWPHWINLIFLLSIINLAVLIGLLGMGGWTWLGTQAPNSITFALNRR